MPNNYADVDLACLPANLLAADSVYISWTLALSYEANLILAMQIPM